MTHWLAELVIVVFVHSLFTNVFVYLIFRKEKKNTLKELSESRSQGLFSPPKLPWLSLAASTHSPSVCVSP